MPWRHPVSLSLQVRLVLSLYYLRSCAAGSWSDEEEWSPQSPPGEANCVTSVHIWRAGYTVTEVAQRLDCSERWVRKGRQRFRQEEGEGLKSRSRRPQRLSRRLPDSVCRAISETRREREAQAAMGPGLKPMGRFALRTRLMTVGARPRPRILLFMSGRLWRSPPISRWTMKYASAGGTPTRMLWDAWSAWT